jgi:hypothetical protein
MIFAKKKKKTSRKRLILWTIIGLNVFSLVCSLIFNNYLYGGNKLADSPLNFFWEWITVFWCVWSSILTCFYCANELKKSEEKINKRQEILGLIAVVGNLLSMVIFMTYLPKQLSEKGIKRGVFWWTYSIIWHFIAIPLSLFYFFKFSKLEKKTIYRKKTFALLTIQPTLFFMVNLTRRFLVAEKKYLTKPWKKYMIPMFEWVEQQKYIIFLLFVVASLFTFWLIAWGLAKLKGIIYPPKKLKLHLIKSRITKINNYSAQKYKK